MNRRTVLAMTGLAVTAPLIGCLDGDHPSETASGPSESDGEAPAGENDTAGPTGGERADATADENTTENEGVDSAEVPEYEVCHFVAIRYRVLPEAIRAEVDAALEDGRYTATSLHFDEAIDPDRSYLVVDDTPYDPVVEDGDEGQTLELHETDVIRAPEPRFIYVDNDDDRDHEVQIELTGDETLVDETVTVPAGGSHEIEATDRFGTYELTARVRTGHEATDTFTFSVDDTHFAGLVTISDSDAFVTQGVADMMPCLWDARGS